MQLKIIFQDMSETLKKSFFIYLIMLVLEFVILILVARHAGWSLSPYMGGFDTNEYLAIGRNLAENQVYSKSSQAPFLPNFTRSPGYPFWLAFVYLIFNSFKPAIFLGMFIFSLSAPLIYLIIREIFSEKLAFWSGIIFALEPRMAFSAPFLLSEQIFLPLFLLAVFFAVMFFIHSENKNYILLSAWTLGISAPIRLISLFLWPFMVIFFFLKLYRKQKTIGIFKILGVATLIFILFILPWSIRNRLVIGTWQPSAIIGTQLYGYLENLRAYRGIPREKTFQEVLVQAARSSGGGGWETPQSVSILTKESLTEIKNNWLTVIRVYIFRAGFFFIIDGYKGIASYITDMKPHFISFADFLTNLRFKEIFSAFKEFSLPELILPILGRVIWLIITLLSFSGIFISYKKMLDYQLILIFFSFLILYFASFTTSVPAMDPRFRMPVNGFLIAFALVSIFYIFKFNFEHKHYD